MGRWLDNVIGTPVECLRVLSEAHYRLWAKEVLSGHGSSPILHDSSEQAAAVVNDGRWIVRCACTNAAIAHPGGAEGWPDPIAICAECGTVYRPTFPKNRASAEAALLARPEVRTRHWEAHERLADLINENAERGLPKRRAAVAPDHGLASERFAEIAATNKALNRGA